jgi:hypothetical protein
MKDRNHLDAMKYFRILWMRRWHALSVFIVEALHYRCAQNPF